MNEYERARVDEDETLQELTSAEFDLKVLELRKEGKTYPAIGEILGINHVDAYRCVKRHLFRVRSMTAETAEEIKQIELERLDSMLNEITARMKTAPKSMLDCIDRVLKIQERRAKYLGIDAPTKVANTNSEGEDLPVIASTISDDQLASIIAGGDSIPDFTLTTKH